MNAAFIILEQQGNRISHQVFYLREGIKPIGNIKKVVPASPDSNSLLMDSVIAFYPEWFSKCKSLPGIMSQLKDKDFLDLDQEMPEGSKNLEGKQDPFT